MKRIVGSNLKDKLRFKFKKLNLALFYEVKVNTMESSILDEYIKYI